MGMCLIRSVAVSGLMALTLSVPVSAQVARLDANVAPTFQRVHLTLDADAPDYSGEVEISLRVAEPTSTFSFHAEGMEITETSLTGAVGSIGVTLSEAGTKGFTTATTERELASGDYTLALTFTNTFDTLANSLYRLEVDSAGYSFTQFEADDAREAFPCWDEPSYKIPWQVTLTVPEAHEAVSNTPFEKESFSDGWKTVTFERTPPLPSYLIAIATGPLEFVEIPGMSIPGRVVCVKGKSRLAQSAVEVTPPILAELERYFDSPYPFKKLDLIAVPEFWAGAMENPGAITYRETILLLDPDKTSVGQRRRQVTVTAHELAHMWFGDLVTMSWWDDLWLNESFATWMGNKISERVYPEFKIEVGRARSGNYVMNSDARPSAQQIRQPITDPDQLMANVGAQYQKGEAVLNMFERWIGEEAFRQGVLNYLKEHEWGNAQAEDLWRALSAASGRDVTGTLAGFIERPGVPRVDVDVQLDGAMTLTQSRFANYGHEYTDAVPWTIPIEIKYFDGAQVRTFDTTMTGQTLSATLETDGAVQWALPNPGSYAYYRWTAPPEIIAAVAESGRERLEPRERIAYLGNLAALLDAGVISGGDYLQALSMFSTDEDPNVIQMVMTGLGKVHSAFVPDAMEDQFAALVRRTLEPAMERFGFEPRDGEDEVVTSLRPSLIGTLADEGQHRGALDHCERAARSYLQDPASVDPGLIGIALYISAKQGDSELYGEYKRRFEAAADPAERSRFLGTLGAFRDTTIWADALQYAFSGKVRPQEFFEIPGVIASHSEASGDFILQWLQDNYVEVTAAMPAQTRMYLPYFAGGCSRGRLAAAREFFLDDSRVTDGVKIMMQKVADQVNDCASLREREGPAVAEFLNSLQ